MKHIITGIAICLSFTSQVYSGTTHNVEKIEDIIDIQLEPKIFQVSQLPKSKHPQLENVATASRLQTLHDDGTQLNSRSTIKATFKGKLQPAFITFETPLKPLSQGQSMYFSPGYEDASIKVGALKVISTSGVTPYRLSSVELSKGTIEVHQECRIGLKYIILDSNDLDLLKRFIYSPPTKEFNSPNANFSFLKSTDTWQIRRCLLSRSETFIRIIDASSVKLFKIQKLENSYDLLFGYKKPKKENDYSLPAFQEGSGFNASKLDQEEIDDYWEKDKYDLIKIVIERKAK